MRPDLLQVFWAGMQAGDFITDAVVPINTSRRTGRRVLLEAGGVRPRRGRDLKGRCLTFAQRELRAQGQSLRQIGAVVGRAASTISRELRRNSVAGMPYRAYLSARTGLRAGLAPETSETAHEYCAACEG
ncbi:helix-turn-helix domain-containing protein [Arthrobacter sp. ISL-95]|nr:helix-turn-helix domain-containing protein [Arthrobacter sp. ISL-95]